MDFTEFVKEWIPKHSLTDFRSLYRVDVYVNENGKMKGILWWDKTGDVGYFNCPLQTDNLPEVKNLHDWNGKPIVKIVYPKKRTNHTLD